MIMVLLVLLMMLLLLLLLLLFLLWVLAEVVLVRTDRGAHVLLVRVLAVPVIVHQPPQWLALSTHLLQQQQQQQ